MCFQGHGFSGFRFGFHPFGFFWCGMRRPFIPREDYLRMLERYKEDLKAELKEVEKEIEDVKKTL